MSAPPAAAVASRPVGYGRLVRAAAAARRRAYAPYSRFAVGAAVLAEDGSIHAGGNVENASYGLTVCAERVAIYGAVAAGCRRLRAVAVAGPAGISPCGACRQVMQEFGVETVILVAPNGRQYVVALRDLLPLPFARLAGTRRQPASRRGQAVLEPGRPDRRNAGAAFSTSTSRVSRRPAHARL